MAEADVEALKLQVTELQEEVGTLRAEIRLIKKKLRDQDPSEEKYRRLIDKLLSEALEKECYWKMVRVDPRVSVFDVQTPINRSSRTQAGMKRRRSDYIDSDDYDLGAQDVTAGYLSWSDEEDSGNETKFSKQTPFRPAHGGILRRKFNGSTDSSRTPVKKGASHSSRSKKVVKVSTPKQTPLPRPVIPEEFKLKVCKRSKEIGPTPAGREFNVPESSVRAWVKRFIALGISLERSQSPRDTETAILGDTVLGKSESGAAIQKSEVVVVAGGGGEDTSWDEGVYYSEAVGRVEDEEVDSDGSYHPGDEEGKRKRRRTSNTSSKDTNSTMYSSARMRDKIWDLYEEGEPKPGIKRIPMICKACGMEVSGEPMRLRRHLKRCEKSTVVAS